MAVNEINYYYRQSAFVDAFNGTDIEVALTVENDVYAGTIEDLNLVVSGGGETGAAGGKPIPVAINDMNIGALSNPVEYTRRLCAYYVQQMDLQQAVGQDLDWMGRNIYGIGRRAGEEDAEYRQRIVNDIFAIKGTKLAIIDVLSPFADKVVIDDDISSGAFCDVSFCGYYKENDPPVNEWIVRGAIAGIKGGIVFHYDITFTNPDLSKANEIVRLLKDYTVGGVEFYIFVD